MKELVELAGTARRIRENARRIERLSHLFRAPGYPREEMRRAALVRENQELFRTLRRDAARLLDPVRREPPPGQWAEWQLLRDVEDEARRASLLGDWEFHDATIPRRLAAIPQPPDRAESTLSR